MWLFTFDAQRSQGVNCWDLWHWRDNLYPNTLKYDLSVGRKMFYGTVEVYKRATYWLGLYCKFESRSAGWNTILHFRLHDNYCQDIKLLICV